MANEGCRMRSPSVISTYIHSYSAKVKYKIPVVNNFCYCIPLKYGLLAYGCLKLILDFAVIVVVSIMLFKNREYPYSYLILIGAMITDFVANVVFVIGVQFRRERHLRLYFYYNIYMLLPKTALFILFFKPILLLWYFPSIIWQVYLMILLKSEILVIKCNQNVVAELGSNRQSTGTIEEVISAAGPDRNEESQQEPESDVKESTENSEPTVDGIEKSD